MCTNKEVFAKVATSAQLMRFVFTSHITKADVHDTSVLKTKQSFLHGHQRISLPVNTVRLIQFGKAQTITFAVVVGTVNKLASLVCLTKIARLQYMAYLLNVNAACRA